MSKSSQYFYDITQQEPDAHMPTNEPAYDEYVIEFQKMNAVYAVWRKSEVKQDIELPF